MARRKISNERPDTFTQTVLSARELLLQSSGGPYIHVNVCFPFADFEWNPESVVLRTDLEALASLLNSLPEADGPEVFGTRKTPGVCR